MKIAMMNLLRSKDRRQFIERNLDRGGLEFKSFADIDPFRGALEPFSVVRRVPVMKMRQESAPIRLRYADELVMSLLRVFDKNTRSAGCEYFLAGELAADLSGQCPAAELRATTEIEFGIAVEGQAQLDLFKKGLIATGEFVAAERAPRRLFYVDGNSYEDSYGNLGWVTQVDLIPFIGTPGAARVVASQATPEGFMNPSGFEVLQSSFSIEVEEGLAIRVAPRAGLTLLDLTCWVCLGQAAGEVAGNLARFFTDYRLEDPDRLPELAPDLIKAFHYDGALASFVFHGREVAGICEKQVLDPLRSALASSDNRRRFAGDIAAAHREGRIRKSHVQETEESIKNETNRLEQIVDAFCTGFLGRLPGES